MRDQVLLAGIPPIAAGGTTGPGFGAGGGELGEEPSSSGALTRAGHRHANDLGPVEHHAGLSADIAGKVECRSSSGLVEPEGVAQVR